MVKVTIGVERPQVQVLSLRPKMGMCPLSGLPHFFFIYQYFKGILELSPKCPLFFTVTQFLDECYTICYADVWDTLIFVYNKLKACATILPVTLFFYNSKLIINTLIGNCTIFIVVIANKETDKAITLYSC